MTRRILAAVGLILMLAACGVAPTPTPVIQQQNGEPVAQGRFTVVSSQSIPGGRVVNLLRDTRTGTCVLIAGDLPVVLPPAACA